MLYTIGSGGLIAILTLILLLAASRDFRKAFIEGPAILANNRHLTKQNGRLMSDITTRKQELASLQSALKVADERQTSAMRSAHAALVEYAVAVKSEHVARRALTVTGHKLQSSLSALSAKQADLFLAQAALQSNVAILTRSKQSYTDEKEKVAQLANQETELNEKIHSKQLEITKLGTRPLVFQKLEEIDRTVVSTRQPYSDIEREVISWLTQLSNRAKDRGAKLGDNGRYVVIVPHGASALGRSVTAFDEAAQIEHIARAIAADHAKAAGDVLVAHAADNIVQGQQIGITVWIDPNVLIYPKGAQIASTEVDGSQTEDIILGELQTFVALQVGPTAIRAGVIPMFDPKRDRPTVGGAGTDPHKTYLLVKHIRDVGVPVIVKAYALRNTYSFGPLELRLSVTPVAQPSSPLHASAAS